MPVLPIPAGYHTVTPYLIIRDASAAVEFYQRAFGAIEVLRLAGPNNTVAHGEIKIGNSIIMLAEENPTGGYSSPQTLGGAATSILLYVEGVDDRFAQAVAAGATVVRPVADQFYGDRAGTVSDPFGHVWTLATHTEDVSQEEINRRMEAMMKPAE